jgi:zinc transporter, ZIP family
MILKLLLTSFIAGSVGTGLGCLIAVLMKNRGKGDFLYGFTAGFILVIVMFDLIPASIEYSGFLTCFISLILGAVFVFVLNKLLHGGIDEEKKTMGLLLFIAIALHNFPEGVAVGAGFEVDLGFAIFISLIMAVHNIPEGMAMGVGLLESGKSKRQVVIFGIIAGLPTCVGALAGNFFAHISPTFVGGGLGFASGAMLYVCLAELVPYGKRHHVKRFYLYLASGIVLGQIVLILVKNLI